MKIQKFNTDGGSVGELELSDAVFNIDYNKQIIYDIIKAENANKRQGNAATKGRSELSGGGAKPWRQKGTGRARQGSIRATQWVGGGVPFGPKPKDFSIKVPQKVKQAAYRAIFSLKANGGQIKALDALSLESHKTSQIHRILKNFNLSDKKQKVTILVDNEDKNLKLAMRNIPHVNYLNVNRLSGRSLFYNKMILGTEEALKKVESILS